MKQEELMAQFDEWEEEFYWVTDETREAFQHWKHLDGELSTCRSCFVPVSISLSHRPADSIRVDAVH
jgi:hypothetical protein